MVRFVLLLLGLGAWMAPGVAGETVEAGDLVIHEAWARASLGNTPNSAAYMTLENLGAEADRLVSGSSPAAEKAELHTHIMEGGVARMRPVAAIEIAPGEPTVLEPGGLHIMLIGLKARLEEGETMPLTLVFERAGEVELEVPVRGVAGRMDHGGHGAMEHGEPKTN